MTSYAGQRPFVVTKETKHTHIRVNMPHGDSKNVTSYSPLAAMHNMHNGFVFKHFSAEYAHDEEADTEYIIVKGESSKGLKVEVHIFSCYCDGEHSETDPPF